MELMGPNKKVGAEIRGPRTIQIGGKWPVIPLVTGRLYGVSTIAPAAVLGKPSQHPQRLPMLHDMEGVFFLKYERYQLM